MAAKYIMVHEVIRNREAEMMKKFSNLPVEGSRTDAQTKRRILKTVRDAEYEIARKCNVMVSWQRVKICGRRVQLSEPRIMLPSLRYVSLEELKKIELGYGGRRE